MFGPLLAIFTEKIGGDVLDITGAWASYLIVTGIITIIVGRILKNTRQVENVMILGYILNTIFTFGYIFVNTPIQLFVIQAALGIASALATPTWEALYAEHGTKGNQILQWGLADGGANIITGIAILIGGVVVGYLSFNVLFIMMGTIQALSTLYLIINYKKIKKKVT
tara:strand:- start:441 stop:944 length:504 start_codon:yes stop_codon:yes gene_type:complete